MGLNIEGFMIRQRIWEERLIKDASLSSMGESVRAMVYNACKDGEPSPEAWGDILVGVIGCINLLKIDPDDIVTHMKVRQRQLLAEAYPPGGKNE